ncbi:MAG: response regulator [Oscillatoriales cyanobacterium C42_A2020_001]|nr:response regulator [Leptolyngbyaceae cyanobacterium C42_A2020_001]
MKTVFIIDDDHLVRESIQYLLESEGFRVIAADCGETGIKLAVETQPDLVLCDVQMPGIDGYEVLAALRDSPVTAVTPFIFLTGRSDKSDLRQGMNLGADDYLTKPFSAKELLAAVDSRLARQEKVRSQSQQQLTDLRQNIALSLPHELKTPLTGIFTSVELLRVIANESDPAEILDIADTIETSAQKLYRLTQNFLLYARLEVAVHDPEYLESLQDDLTMQPELVISNTALEIAKRTERSADLCLEVQGTTIAISTFDLEKAIAEVLDNAFKFSPPRTPVIVTSSIEADFYQIKVKNYGYGMTAQQIADLGGYMQFNRKFYEQQGVGLGLAIAKRLVELRNGYLKIQSIPYETTTVELTIPRAPLLPSELLQ